MIASLRYIGESSKGAGLLNKLKKPAHRRTEEERVNTIDWLWDHGTHEKDRGTLRLPQFLPSFQFPFCCPSFLEDPCVFVSAFAMGFLCGSAGKESTCNAGDLASVPGLGRSPGEGKGYPLQYSGLENSLDYSPWGCKELDMTERLSLCHAINSAAELNVEVKDFLRNFTTSWLFSEVKGYPNGEICLSFFFFSIYFY